jgi:glucose-6-phosphate isomerase
VTSLAEWPEFQTVLTEAARLKPRHLRELFAEDAERFARFSLRVGGVLFDHSKQRIDAAALDSLIALAKAVDLEGWRERLFSGEAINTTEKRAVLHTALRADDRALIALEGGDVMPEVRRVRAQMARFADAVRKGVWRGHTGKAIADVVNIGIGGSDLGARMAVEALEPYRAKHLRFHFVANIDGAALAETLARCDPATTLFLVASKTFTTQETITNAKSARGWLVDALQSEAAVAKHFVALSTNAKAVHDFGIAPENMFPFRDWVGGRFSVWSAIGLSVMLAIGRERFGEFLDGAAAMDAHFQTAPLSENAPALMALLGVWNINALGQPALAILPYDDRLRRFPAFLQQLDMESNGKSVMRDGGDVRVQTAPIVFGEPGTNGQHAFHQMLHQGPLEIPCDVIAAAQGDDPFAAHHDILLAHALAQTQALAFGRTAMEIVQELRATGMSEVESRLLALHKRMPGNRPSTTILVPTLDPYHLGFLIALYEHKIFVQGVLWGLNSFDQWGVELGKVLAGALLPKLQGKDAAPSTDSSTNGLLDALRKQRRS